MTTLKETNKNDKVLIVDDTPENISVLYEFLTNNALDVLVALNGETALDIVENEMPSLILLDVMMPDMNGFEVCQRLKANPKFVDIPVIFITALSDVSHKVRGFEMGAVDYVIKPLQQEEVLARINTHLTIRRLQTKLRKQNQELADKKNELQQANQKLQQLANLDGLTQVANRRYFDQQIKMQWQQLKQSQQPLSFVLCDVDFFKNYNDTYGHLAGDECLRQVAQTLQHVSQSISTAVARYGGEEFALILPNMTVDSALQIAHTIQEQLALLAIPHSASTVSPYLTISIGVACMIPNDNSTPNNLIDSADKALYIAKNNGRNRVVSSKAV